MVVVRDGGVVVLSDGIDGGSEGWGDGGIEGWGDGGSEDWDGWGY